MCTSPAEVPIKSEVIIRTQKQNVVYEGEGIMCTGCGNLGHVTKNCQQVPQFKHTGQTSKEDEHKEKHANDGWQIVNFPRRTNAQSKDKAKGTGNR
ncbi:hypothetical protein RDI58_024218 [Solanum bulbocastanum]|uniref:CCHC-type domain-containing protein n=1 Tax=Solanum bulbocastanum TaxID=147425 RepID=A0AAN8T5F2_SOLBU